ncbi:MAG: putative S-layer protein [Nanoarchaeota archaeon]
MANKNALLSLGIILCLLASLSLVSSALNTDVTLTPVKIPETVLPNSEVTIYFNLTNLGVANYSGLTWVGSSNIGNWKELPSSTDINASQTKQLSGILVIPQYASGIIKSNLTLKNGTEQVTFFLPQISINETSSLSISVERSLTLNQNATILIKNNGNKQLNGIKLNASGDFNANFSENDFSLSPGSSKNINVSSNQLDKLSLKTNSITIQAKASDGTTASTQLNYAKSFCRYGNVGDSLEIEWIKDKSNLDNDWEWKPLDDITAEVRIYNKGDKDLDLTVELIFVDTSGDVIEDFVLDEDDLMQDVSVDNDQKEKFEFNFKISPDVEDGDYQLYAKVYKENDEDQQCTSLVAEEVDNVQYVEINKEKNEVLVREIEGPQTASCDETIELNAKVYNVGRTDEDQVQIRLYNKELGIDISKEIDNLDQGDYDTVSFLVKIPKNAEEKQYRLTTTTFFDYDEDDDSYSKHVDIDKEFKYDLSVSGNCQKQTNQPVINANLISDALVGEELVVQASITNLGEESESFIIKPVDYESWAELLEINPVSLTVAQGETKQVTLKFKPNQAGAHSFKINALHNGQTDEQTVSVNISEKETSAGFFDRISKLGNKELYIISAMAGILIILILILIIKLSRKSKRRSEF